MLLQRPVYIVSGIADNNTMNPETDKLRNALKLCADLVAQGLERKPVTGPVKNVAGRIFIVLAAVLVSAKLTMDFAASETLKQLAIGVAVVSFLLAVSAMLLQWNRSLLWHRSRRAAQGTSNSQGLRIP